MSERQVTFNGDTEVLYRQAVRTPLPDEDAERVFYENMMNVADAQEWKAEMLADPDVSNLEAHEKQLDRIAASYKRRCRHIAGDDYEEVAHAYQRGERDDHVGALTAYYFEGLWRMQQRITVTDMLFFPIILRYPDSFTVNIRFASGYKTTDSVFYESPEHSDEELDDKYVERYYNDSLYSQKAAAKNIRETAQIIREEFQNPDEVSFDERKYGGIVSAAGRKGSVFSSMLQRVEPDPDRFSEPVDQPTLVDEGPEAARTERELLPDGCIVI
ncbi:MULTISPECIES: hypothetical protein [Haloferax]|uniref:Uncharacterized protein n=2 Tax=Haloferax TaxID=2251 RepID=A0A6G1Z1C0_9EURY|nr:MULTISPECIES: hypothetical protein [Haloferax]KAB1187626.1 hypothetical protein Hfx1149_06115 [Haloferax sp. CBA1149]MRW80285.1 hypothetical protein [Haloferax marinisediminis]